MMSIGSHLVAHEQLSVPERNTVRPANTICVIGNSIVAAEQPFYDAGAAYVYKWNAKGAFQWANYMLGQRFYPRNIKGYSGQTSTQIVANFGADVTAYKPDYCWLQIFENDITNSISLTESTNNLKAIVRANQENGTVTIVSTCLPSLGYTTTAHSIAWEKLNAWIMNYAQRTHGVIALDFDWVYKNTALATATPQPLSGYTDSSVHPNLLGAYKLGERAFLILDPIVRKTPIFHAHYNSASTADSVFWPNPLMVGTAAATAPATGNGAQSTTSQSPGAGVSSCAFSKVARTDGLPGEWVQADYTHGAGAVTTVDEYVQITAAQKLISGAEIVAGDTVQLLAEFDAFTNTTANAVWVPRVLLRFNGAGGTSATDSQWSYGMNIETSAEYVKTLPPIRAGVVATYPTVVPANCTGLTAYVRAVASAANCQFSAKFGRVSIRKIQAI